MAVYFNADGLALNFGTAKATNETAGEYRTLGELRSIEVNLDLTTLTTSPTIISNNLKFPTGVFIQEVIVVTNTAVTSGGSTTLDIGLIGEDRSTVISATGLVASIAKASIAAAGTQNTLVVGSSGAGALLGTATAAVGYLTATANVAVFTAGKLRVRINYYAATPITQ